jgi:hypothetical protein
MESRENLVREWVQDGILNVLHVKGQVNPANIFTKEMRDGAHFWGLRDSFMCHLSDFLQQSLLAIHHSHPTPQQASTQVAPLATPSRIVYAQNSYFAALCSSPLCQTFSAISHLSSTGCYLLRRFHHVVPPGLI